MKLWRLKRFLKYTYEIKVIVTTEILCFLRFNVSDEKFYAFGRLLDQIFASLGKPLINVKRESYTPSNEMNEINQVHCTFSSERSKKLATNRNEMQTSNAKDIDRSFSPKDVAVGGKVKKKEKKKRKTEPE